MMNNVLKITLKFLNLRSQEFISKSAYVFNDIVSIHREIHSPKSENEIFKKIIIDNIIMAGIICYELFRLEDIRPSTYIKIETPLIKFYSSIDKNLGELIHIIHAYVRSSYVRGENDRSVQIAKRVIYFINQGNFSTLNEYHEIDSEGPILDYIVNILNNSEYNFEKDANELISFDFGDKDFETENNKNKWFSVSKFIIYLITTITFAIVFIKFR
jgi:hypothetical protein